MVRVKLLRLQASLAWFSLIVLFAAIGPPALGQESEQETPLEQNRTFGWFLDLGAGQGYDNNFIGQGGDFTQFDAVLHFHQAWEKNFWSLGSQSTLQRFYTNSVADHIFVNESVSAMDSWQVSHRWTLNLKGQFDHTSDPFTSGQNALEAEPVSGPVVVDPNSAFIGPELPITVFSGSAVLRYQVGRFTELAFGGDYFSNREPSLLANFKSHAFHIAYTKMVRRGQSIGFLYALQSFDVTNLEQQVTTHSVFLTYSYTSNGGWQIGLSAGPQYSLLNSNSVSVLFPPSLKGNLLTFFGEAKLSKSISKENFVQLTASRRVTDTAGIAGIAVQNEGRLNFSLRFKQHLSLSVGGFYSEYEPLGTLPLFGLGTASGAFNRAVFDLTPHSSIVIDYNYDRYSGMPISVAIPYSHQRVAVEYHYSFGGSPSQR